MAMTRRFLVILAIVLGLGTVLYFPGLDGPMFFDDLPWLASNATLRIDGTSFEEWRIAALSSTSGPTGRPLAMLSFAANYIVFGGESIFALKAVNLAIHLISGVLIYFAAFEIAKLCWQKQGLEYHLGFAIVAATIWLLHPLHVSTVLYAIQRMAQLSALFLLLGIVLFLRSRAQWAAVGATSGQVIAVALWLGLITLASTFSKENGLVLPWILLVIEVCLFRGRWSGNEVIFLRRAGNVLLTLSGVAFLWIAVSPPDTISQMFAGREFSLQERLLTQMRVLWMYVGWLVFPDITMMGFQHDYVQKSTELLTPVSTIFAIWGWVAVVLIALVLKRRHPIILLGVLIFLVGHSVESTVLPLEMVYEHRNYLPSLGVVLILAAGFLWAFNCFTRSTSVAAALSILCILGGLLWLRVDVWSVERRLMESNVKNHPASSRSNYFYADALLREFREATRLGAAEKEVKDLVLTSRYYFSRMYETNPRDVAALVMLYSIDSRFFPRLSVEEDWLGKLHALLQTRVLQPSDYNAIDALIDCVTSSACVGEPSSLTGIIETLRLRYPDSLTVLSFEYKLLVHTGAPVSELELLIDQALSKAPGNRFYLYQRLVLQNKKNDFGAMYESARLWLYHDKKRQSVLTLRSLFSEL